MWSVWLCFSSRVAARRGCRLFASAALATYQHTGMNRRGTSCHLHAIEKLAEPSKVSSQRPTVVYREGNNPGGPELDGRPAANIAHLRQLKRLPRPRRTMQLPAAGREPPARISMGLQDLGDRDSSQGWELGAPMGVSPSPSQHRLRAACARIPVNVLVKRYIRCIIHPIEMA